MLSMLSSGVVDSIDATCGDMATAVTADVTTSATTTMREMIAFLLLIRPRCFAFDHFI